MAIRWTRPAPKPKRPEKVNRPKKTVLSSVPLEEDEQSALCEWMNIKKILYQASALGAFMHPATFTKMQKIGCKAGFPDIMIFDRPPKYPEYVGVAIEMKRKKGGKISDEQSEWCLQLAVRKWEVRVCLGADDAIKFLTELGF